MNKKYQVYSITNIINNKVYIAHTNKKVDLNTKYYSTNKALLEDIQKFNISNFKRTLLKTAETKHDIKLLYRETLLEFKRNNIILYNDICAYGYVYLTICLLNGMKYIGQHRISGNKDDEYFGSGIFISSLIKKYGKSYFQKQILQECYSADELDNMERYWIKKYNAVKSPMFYNIAEGGQFGDVWAGKSQEDKEKFSKRIAESNRTRIRDTSKISGDKNPAFGRHWYKDVINKCQYYLYPDDELIKALNLERGMFRSKSHNEKIKNALKGKKKTYKVYACNCKWMHLKGSNKKEDRVFVKEHEVEKYLKLGYVFGMREKR